MSSSIWATTSSAHVPLPRIIQSTKANNIRRNLSKASSPFAFIVLDSGNEFRLQRAILELSSEYFAAVFRSPDVWANSSSEKIQLYEIEDNIFAIFQEWVETGEVRSILTNTQIPSQTPVIREKQSTKQIASASPVLANILGGNKEKLFPAQINDRLELLFHCYALGDYLRTPSFQNMIMDQIIDEYCNFTLTHNGGFPLHYLHIIPLSSTTGNPL